MKAETILAPNGRHRVRVRLFGLDGNSFAIVGRCREAMRAAGWSLEAIEAFSKETTSGDREHLLRVVFAYCEHLNEEEEE